MLNALKSELEKKVGFALDSFKNCRRLENLLQHKGLYISYSSLARMFSVGNKTSEPRLSTLNELSVFLGYQSYEHFNQFNENSSEKLEAYTRKVLEMKSELFFGNRLKGLELFIDIRKKFGSLSDLLSQELALQLYNKQDLPKNELEHLVAKGITEVHFMDFSSMRMILLDITDGFYNMPLKFKNKVKIFKISRYYFHSEKIY